VPILGPHLFPGWEDSAGRFFRFHLFRGFISRKMPGQMFPCQIGWGTSGLVDQLLAQIPRLPEVCAINGMVVKGLVHHCTMGSVIFGANSGSIPPADARLQPLRQIYPPRLSAPDL